MPEPADARKLALEQIRFEIDSLDDEICRLLERRFSAVEHVRAAKSEAGKTTPIRPAREYSILNRLVGRPSHLVSAELKVRLWRTIMSAATLNQAPVTINVSASLGASLTLRLLIQEHFGPIPVIVRGNEENALRQLVSVPSSLCVVEPESNWARAFAAGEAGGARVIGCLPIFHAAKAPGLLILGEAESEATGHDETVVISKGRFCSAVALWQVASDGCVVAAFSGFHLEPSHVVEHLISHQSHGVIVAGHYSRISGVRS